MSLGGAHRRPERRPERRPDPAEHLRRWSATHGVEPASVPLVTGWLRLVHGLAAPLARAGVPADLLTLLGLGVALASVPVAALGGRWPVLVAVLVLLAALLDGLDGAVAVLRDRSTRWGAVLDALADRFADTAYLVALGVLGAPAPLVLAAAAVALAHEYVRAVARSVGLAEVAVVTVSERPTRVVVAAMSALAAGVLPGAAAGWATAGAGTSLVLGTAGLVQLLVVVRRRLAAPDPG